LEDDVRDTDKEMADKDDDIFDQDTEMIEIPSKRVNENSPDHADKRSKQSL
jgi:hypothetical protein